MDSVSSRRRARLVLLPDSPISVSSELPTPSDASGDGEEDPPGRDSSRHFRKLSPAAPAQPLRLSPSSDDELAPAMNRVALTDRFSGSQPDPSEELGQGLGQGLGWLGGAAIALLTLLVPLTSVVMDRQDQPRGLLLPRVTDSGQRHGPHNPSGLSSARVGESVGGDSGRKP